MPGFRPFEAGSATQNNDLDKLKKLLSDDQCSQLSGKPLILMLVTSWFNGDKRAVHLAAFLAAGSISKAFTFVPEASERNACR
jgi:hypothetical protein